ncbi:hypothetical protein EDEG_03763 [Edhazardia aedis USNM 41457]|uniref:Transmembrane protein n=1 Tax=Edhazardia aedis (strain USNM 41457) TaxID=1003232 RepID=J9DGI5_EDHAE|nr:hypothetical protein EDEG_03763 [Edhazardia aedis USNM 41457]|eukprot:EJW01710.1 hypothetical protein EDEG_03763 [Edhazardia aedis USNM 41457]
MSSLYQLRNPSRSQDEKILKSISTEQHQIKQDHENSLKSYISHYFRVVKSFFGFPVIYNTEQKVETALKMSEGTSNVEKGSMKFQNQPQSSTSIIVSIDSSENIQTRKNSTRASTIVESTVQVGFFSKMKSFFCFDKTQKLNTNLLENEQQDQLTETNTLIGNKTVQLVKLEAYIHTMISNYRRSSIYSEYSYVIILNILFILYNIFLVFFLPNNIHLLFYFSMSIAIMFTIKAVYEQYKIPKTVDKIAFCEFRKKQAFYLRFFISMLVFHILAVSVLVWYESYNSDSSFSSENNEVISSLINTAS